MFTNHLQYYPIGGPLNVYGLFNSYIGIVFFEIFDDIAITYNFLVYLSFILNGYGKILVTIITINSKFLFLEHASKK